MGDEKSTNKSGNQIVSVNEKTAFLWGAATSSYQVEGGITTSDWDYFTRSPKIRDRIVKLTTVASKAANSNKNKNRNDNKRRNNSSSSSSSLSDEINASRYQVQHQHPQEERDGIVTLKPAGEAVRAWDPQYYKQDFDNARKLGLNALRISLEWSRIQPEKDSWDASCVNHYRNMIEAMHSRGLTPIVTLNHFTLPLWVSTPPIEFSKNALFDMILPSNLKHLPLPDPVTRDPFWKALRGWENHSTVDEFVKFVSKIVNEFKDIVDYWITINEPVASVVGVGYIAGLWPPGFVLDGNRAKIALHNLIEAHVQAYDKITSIDNVDSDGDNLSKRVGFSHAMVAVLPAEPTKLFGRKIVDNTNSARNLSYFINDYFLNAVIFGEEDINYLNKLQRHNESSENFVIHNDWKDKVDFVGINYYRRVYVNYSNVLAMSSARFLGGMLINDLNGHHQPHGLLNGLGWEIYPEGLYDFIMQVKTRWNKPVMITENGIAEESDKFLGPFIVSHVQQVKRAIDNGAHVLGYTYWSLMDTYEWQEKYEPEGRFGLYYVERDGESADSNNNSLNAATNNNTISNGSNINKKNSYLNRTLKGGAKALQTIISESQSEDGSSDVITDSAIFKAMSVFGTFTPDGRGIKHELSK